ncbi:MAG: hypothetical protein GX811_07710 [Lentisphaerae bacterium]|jgi:hypothetical protein|nr:hypothetical protein [Lentisphaerota bacterium]
MNEKIESGRITAALVLDTTSKDIDEIEQFVNEKTATNLIFVKRAPRWVKLKVKQDCGSREGIEENELRETRTNGERTAQK